MGYYGDKCLCNAGDLQTPGLFAADPRRYPPGQVRPVLVEQSGQMAGRLQNSGVGIAGCESSDGAASPPPGMWWGLA